MLTKEPYSDMRMLRDMSGIATWIAELSLKSCAHRCLNYTTCENLMRTNDLAATLPKAVDLDIP